MKNTHCSVCGSNKEVRNYRGKDILCGMHREQMRRHGEIRKRTLASRNEFTDKGDHYEMVIYGRDLKEKARSLVDKEDRWLIEKVGSWCLENQGYAMNGVKKLKLHQLVMGKKKGLEIDHINGNKLDNRKFNLRHVTHKENSQNWEYLRRRKLVLDFKAHLAEGKDAKSFFSNLIK
jgi:hypothetical protein